MEMQSNPESGGQDKLTTSERDARKTVENERPKALMKDACKVLEFFQNARLNDPSFYHKIHVDEEFRFLSCFWSDGSSQLDYQAFGDVVYFKTINKTNAYGMPFGSFIGINHHKQCIVFAAGFIRVKSEEDFKWLFEAFFKAMGGMQPKAIITDPDPMVATAAAETFPKADHKLCMWNLLKKLHERLGPLYNESSTFAAKFDACIHADTVEEFETSWVEIMEQYDLKHVDWLQHMYECRKKWVPIYLKSTFLAGMFTTRRSKSMDSLFEGYVGHRWTLFQSVMRYQNAIKRRRDDEVKADYDSAYETPKQRTALLMDNELAKIYTKDVFCDVQDELFESVAYEPELVEKNGPNSTFDVMHSYLDVKNYNVVFNKEKKKATCRCLLFEFKGIVCRHVLAVFRTERVVMLPPHYILKRWTKDAKIGLQSSTERKTPEEMSAMTRRDELYRLFSKITLVGSKLSSGYEFTKVRMNNLIAEVEEINKEVEGGMIQADKPFKQATDVGSLGGIVEAASFNKFNQIKKRRSVKIIKSRQETPTIKPRMCRSCKKPGHYSTTCSLLGGRSRGRGRRNRRGKSTIDASISNNLF